MVNSSIRQLAVWFFLFALLSGDVAGQSAAPTLFDTHSIMPTSPDAAMLGRFGEIPIGYYTGTAGISIPIYTIEDKGAHFSLPIVLRYHSSGVKVEDQAPIVGLGWSLEGEGSIIQIVNGKEDTLDNMIATSPSGYAALKEGQILGEYTQRPSTCAVMSSSSDSYGDTYTTMTQAQQGDGQPDLYIYNFAGYSGKFYVNPETHQVVLIDPKEQITFVRTGQHTWSATTIDGNVFYFNILENSYTGSLSNYSGYTSKLSSIQLNDGKQITFGYTAGFYQWYEYLENYHEYYPFGINSSEFGVIPTISPSYNYVQYLNSITANNVTINFNLEARGDLGGSDPLGSTLHSSRLKSIDLIDPVTGRMIKSFLFGYSYFPYTTSGGDFTNRTGASKTQAQLDTIGKRLRLDSLTEKGYAIDGTVLQKPAYKFYYDTQTLPLKTSYARDYWGYYNGVTTNAGIMPDLNFLYQAQYPGYTTIPAQVLTDIQGANRAPDRHLCTAGVLNKVVYPTGGYTVFAYEPNMFNNFMYPDQTKITDASHQGFISDNNVSSDVITSPHISFNKAGIIKVNNAIVRGVNTSVTLDQLQPSYISLIKVKNGMVTTLNTWQMTLTAPYIDSFSTGSNYRCTWLANVLIPFDSGAYYVLNTSLPDNLGAQASPSNNATVTCAYAYAALPDSDTVVSYGGGVRIASISSYDQNGNIASKKLLRYINKDSTTSGVLMSPLTFMNIRPMLMVNWTAFIVYPGGNYNQWQQAYDTVPFMTSESFVPYSDGAQGNPVGYSRVEAIDVAPDGSTNGKHVFLYHNQPSQTMPDNPDNPDLLNGNITQEQVWDASGDSLQEINYTYLDNYAAHSVAPPAFDGIKLIPYFAGSGPSAFAQDPVSSPNWSLYNYEIVNFYPITCAWYLLHSKTTNNYSGANVVSSTDTYLYNMLGQMTEVDSYNSKNQPIASQYIYPHDTSTSESSLLTAGGLLNEMIGEREWVGSSLLSKVDIYYGYHGAYVEDSIVRTYNTGNSFNDFSFSQYGTYKTLQQYTKRNNLASVLWDYKNEIPIAEVINAGQSNIAYTSFEADGNGNWTLPDTSRSRAFALTGNLSYRLKGSNSIVKSSLNSATTYIVGYWALNDSAVTVNGSAGTKKAVLGSWTYREASITGVTSVTVGGTGTIDELRLYPKGALMTTYTYAPLIGMTTQCDPSGKITYYTYDGLGRLKLIKDQYGNILKRYDYQYQTTNQ